MRALFKIKDADRAHILRSELTKVRCWLTGFHAGQGDKLGHIPGEDSIRQIILALDDALKKAEG